MFRLASNDHERRSTFWGIVAVALLLRVYVCFFSGKNWFSTDSFGYFTLADAILSGEPYSYTPNGYPLLIAAVKLLVRASWVPAVLVCINIASSVTVVVLVIYIAGALHPSFVVRYSAGLLCALLPSQVNYVRYLYSEAATAGLFTAGIALLVSERYTTAGLLLYAANLFRSTLGPVVPLAGLCLVALRRAWRRAILLLVGATVGALLYAQVEAAGIVRPPGNFAANILLAIGEDQDAWAMTGSDDFYRSAAVLRRYLVFARDHPRDFLRQRLVSAWDLWGPWPPAGSAPGRRPRSPATRALLGLRFPLLILAVVGFARNRRSLAVWICALPVGLVSLTHVLLYAEARYTYVVEPLVVVLAAIGAYSFLPRVASSGIPNGTLSTPRSST